MKVYKYVFVMLAVFHGYMGQAQKDELRRDEKSSEIPLPNNCDDIIYAVTLRGVILSLGNQQKNLESLEIKSLLPFRCNAIAKTFNNKILAVEADKSIALTVYEVNPITKSGKYTKWKLPTHNDGGWISGGTDNMGRIYFSTTTMKVMVRIDLRMNEIEVLWSSKDKIEGGNKIGCSEGCNFYINEKSDILIKENRKNMSYSVVVDRKPYIKDIKNMEGFFNSITINDWYEYGNDKNLSLFALKDGIMIFKEGEYRPKTIIIDTLKYGLVTDIAGCNSNENKKPRFIINKKREEEILEAARKKENIRLEKINFRLGQSELQPASIQELDELVMILLKNKQLKILLEGHTDVNGDTQDNMKLSYERANVCREYLIKYGVNPNRITARGFGNTQPIITSGSEKDRAPNRRVEIKFLE